MDEAAHKDRRVRPNRVVKAERVGSQGKGPARKLGKTETYGERKARLAAQGRDLDTERRARRNARVSRRPVRTSAIDSDAA